MSNYTELLKDPRWQKKRLEIMDRDGFTCQVCNCGIEDGVPLNVHHIAYKNNAAPWEYEDEQLITLCENCHQKIHNKEIILSIPKKKSEKKEKVCAVLYKYFLNNREGLSINESIIYSTIVWKSVLKLGWNDSTNRFDINTAMRFIQNNISGYINTSYYSIRGLAKKLHMSESTIREIIHSLRDKHIIEGDSVKCSVGLVESGYYVLPINTGLKSTQLAFYAFLKDRSNSYHGTIDTWARRLSELFGISKKHVYSLFVILHRKGFAERLENGKLKIK